MSTAAQDFLNAFDSLPAATQHEVAVEIIRRTATVDDIPDAAFDELAGELFRSYDVNEPAETDGLPNSSGEA